MTLIDGNIIYHATPILIISVSVIVLLVHETDEGTPQIKQNIQTF